MNLTGGRNCIHCGRQLPAEDRAHRDKPLDCCGCGAVMTPRRLEDTRFDECDRCGGLWLCPATVASVGSQAEARARLRPFDLMPKAAEPGAKSSGGGAYRRCPICARHMNRSNYARGAGVVVDVCKDHGSFFDQGELTRIVLFIEEGGLEKMRRREDEDLRSRRRDVRRQAIQIGAPDPETSFATGVGGGSGLDLLGLLSRVLGVRIQ